MIGQSYPFPDAPVYTTYSSLDEMRRVLHLTGSIRVTRMLPDGPLFLVDRQGCVCAKLHFDSVLAESVYWVNCRNKCLPLSAFEVNLKYGYTVQWSDH